MTDREYEELINREIKKEFDERARKVAEGFIMSANEIAEINHWQKELFVEQVKRYMRGENE